MSRRADQSGDPTNPAYYRRGGTETLDYIFQIVNGLPPDEAILVGHVVRYLSRYRHKNEDDPARDIEKARWYLDTLARILAEKGVKNGTP